MTWPYFRTTCNIRPRFLGPIGGLKIEGLLYYNLFIMVITYSISFCKCIDITCPHPIQLYKQLHTSVSVGIWCGQCRCHDRWREGTPGIPVAGSGSSVWTAGGGRGGKSRRGKDSSRNINYSGLGSGVGVGVGVGSRGKIMIWQVINREIILMEMQDFLKVLLWL